MTRPPHAASSVVGYASDTASAVAKVEPNSNRSRETGRPYWGHQTRVFTTDDHIRRIAFQNAFIIKITNVNIGLYKGYSIEYTGFRDFVFVFCCSLTIPRMKKARLQ